MNNEGQDEIKKDKLSLAAKRWTLGSGWRLLRIGGEDYLLGEADLVRVTGEAQRGILGKIAAGQELHEIEARLGSDALATELARMSEAGFALECAAGREREYRFWRALGINGADAENRLMKGVALQVSSPGRENLWTEALREAGIPVIPDGAVVLCEVNDYACQEVLEANQHRLEDRRDWLLCRSDGAQIWLGPWIQPGRGACAACLAKRLRENRWVESIARKLELTLDSSCNLAYAGAGRFAVQAAVMEVARYLALGVSGFVGRLGIWNAAEGKFERYRVERIPSCQACRGRGIPGTPSRWTPNVNPWTGFLRNSTDLTPARDWPVRLWGVQFTAPEGAGECFEAISPQWATGRGRSAKAAKRKAIYEAVERRASYWHGDEPCIQASAAELGDLAVSVPRWLSFSDAQHEDPRNPRRFQEHAQISWRAAINWRRDEVLHFPAKLTQMGWPEAADWTPGADSNGCAAGKSFSDAALRAVLELIERDAAAIWWYGRIARPRLDLSSVSRPWTRKMLGYFETLGLRPHIYDISNDWEIPIYAATLRSAGKVYLGLGCDFSAESALRNSVSELYQSLYARSAEPAGDANQFGWMDKYSKPIKPNPQLAGQDSTDKLNQIVRKGKQVGVEFWFVDLSREEYGCKVARVFGPGLRHSGPRFGPGRLYDVPSRLGWIDHELMESELNSVPLPI